MKWMCLALLLASTAWSQDAEEIDRIVPYAGHLDQDGAPFSGTIRVRFLLYDQAEGGLPLWGEERVVQVRTGRFSARLDAGDCADPMECVRVVLPPAEDGAEPFEVPRDPIETVVGQDRNFYLALAIRSADDGPLVALAGRQQIVPVPQALWTAPSDMTLKSLRVDESLAIGVDEPVLIDRDGPRLRLGGGLIVNASLFHEGPPPFTIQDDAFITGFLDVRTNIRDGDSPEVTINDGLRVTQDLRVDGATRLNGPIALVGAVSDGTNNSPVTIADGLEVTGDLTQSTIQPDGTWCAAGVLNGTRSAVGPTTNTHYCSLFRVEALGGGSSCQIRNVNDRWQVDAFGLDTVCQMVCLRVMPGGVRPSSVNCP